MPKQGSKGKSHASSEVERFARAFKTEKELREHLETLFRKMGRLEVRITHGTSERGKDIVFYGPSGLDDHSLYACVVKNDRIVGDVTSPTAAQVVFTGPGGSEVQILSPINSLGNSIGVDLLLVSNRSPHCRADSKINLVQLLPGIRLLRCQCRK